MAEHSAPLYVGLQAPLLLGLLVQSLVMSPQRPLWAERPWLPAAGAQGLSTDRSQCHQRVRITLQDILVSSARHRVGFFKNGKEPSEELRKMWESGRKTQTCTTWSPVPARTSLPCDHLLDFLAGVVCRLRVVRCVPSVDLAAFLRQAGLVGAAQHPSLTNLAGRPAAAGQMPAASSWPLFPLGHLGGMGFACLPGPQQLVYTGSLVSGDPEQPQGLAVWLLKLVAEVEGGVF